MRIRKPKKAVLRKRAFIAQTRVTTSRETMLIRLINAIKMAQKEEREIKNMNKFYAAYGFVQTNPIYFPPKTKLNGYKKQRSSFNKKR